jgi:hypothetical protein
VKSSEGCSTLSSAADFFENVAAPPPDTLQNRGAATFLYLFAREGVTHILHKHLSMSAVKRGKRVYKNMAAP